MSLKAPVNFAPPDPKLPRIVPMVALMCALIRDSCLIILGHPWTVKHALGNFKKDALANAKRTQQLFCEEVDWLYFDAERDGITFTAAVELIRARTGYWYHPDRIRADVMERYGWLFPDGQWEIRHDATAERKMDFFNQARTRRGYRTDMRRVEDLQEGVLLVHGKAKGHDSSRPV